MRILALKLNILDRPHSNVKTHKEPVPYLGGLSIAISFWFALTFIRFLTSFPTGTLRSLRGIFLGSLIIVILGLIDDIKKEGLHFKLKFLVQISSAILLILYGIKMEFIKPEWFALIVTIIWIVGITNSLNIIDIMDGLSSGVAFIASLGFFFIGLPTEEKIYVNFASIALAGACLGFLPYNLSQKSKIFMGDTGSLFIGFILSSISLGTKYTDVNNIGLFAPILVLAIPIYDTFLVMYFRWKKGISPFLGSKDHFALRLEKIGFSRKKILFLTYIAGIILAFISFVVTITKFYYALIIYLITFSIALFFAIKLGEIKIE
ncbi:MAG: MraY family glycosyltransferase [Endomicrobiia bacterium]